jgi:hypothetical protein
MTSTQLFAQAVDPYSQRFSPPGAIFQPYGWGPGFNVGMPMNYSHHIGYERVPLRPGTYDVLSGTWSGSAPGGASYAHLAGVTAVL